MKSIALLYKEHLSTLQLRIQKILHKHKLDGLLIHAGEPVRYFFNDQYYPFKVNPYFKAWLPVINVPHCWLWVNGINKPKLWYYLPIDYWHYSKPISDSFWVSYIDVVLFTNPNEIYSILPKCKRIAYLGSALYRAIKIGIKKELINPKSIINCLNFYRTYKTDYEIFCMREAQKIAIKGHMAAKKSFLAAMCEFDIHINYLNACSYRDDNLPYNNIVAINEHAGFLHYNRLDREQSNCINSLLIDAGAEYNGYVADISRTYATQQDSDFASLISALNHEQQNLIAGMKNGSFYNNYHTKIHNKIAKILYQFNIITNLSVEAIVSYGITSLFMPHRLGHSLGLQVHDALGSVKYNKNDICITYSSNCSYLQCKCLLYPRMVLAVEPGIYFIEVLLAPWRESSFSRYFNWSQIEHFKTCGGIRIEDNIIIYENHIENMTRNFNLD